jgi:hypothetical protein
MKRLASSIGFQPVPRFTTHGPVKAATKRKWLEKSVGEASPLWFFPEGKARSFAYITADGPFERNEPVPKGPSLQAYRLEAYATLPDVILPAIIDPPTPETCRQVQTPASGHTSIQAFHLRRCP